MSGITNYTKLVKASPKKCKKLKNRSFIINLKKNKNGTTTN